MPLGDLGNLHIGTEVDLSGLTVGLAKAEAEMRAAAERMSSSATTNLGQVRTVYTQAADAAEQSGVRQRNAIRQIADETTRSSTSIRGDVAAIGQAHQQTATDVQRSGGLILGALGQIAQGHRDTDRDSSAASLHIASGLRNLAGAFGDLGPAANLAFGTLRANIPPLNAAVTDMENVWRGSTSRIGQSFGDMRFAIETHVDNVRLRLASLGGEALTPFRNAITSIGNESANAFARMRAGLDDAGSAFSRFGSNGIGNLRGVGEETGRGIEHSKAFLAATEALSVGFTVGAGIIRQRMEEVRGAVEIAKVAFAPLADVGRRAFEGIGESAGGVASRLGTGFEGALSNISGLFRTHMGDSSTTVDTHSRRITGALGTVERDGVGAARRAGRGIGDGVQLALPDLGNLAREAVNTGSTLNRVVATMTSGFGSLVSAVPSLGGVGRIFTTMSTGIAEGGTKSGYAIAAIIYGLILLAGELSFFAAQAIGAVVIIGVFVGALIGAATAAAVAIGIIGGLGIGIVALAASYAGWANSGEKVAEAQSKVEQATKAHDNALQDLKHQQDAWNQSSTHSQTQLDSLQRAEKNVTDTGNALTQAQKEYNDAVEKSHNPLTNLTNALTKMKDTLGKAAVPLAGPLLDALTAMVPKVTEIGLKILGWFKGIEPTVLEALNAGFEHLLGIANALGAPFENFFNRMEGIGRSKAFQDLSVIIDQFVVSTLAGLLDNLARVAEWFVNTMPTWGPVVGSIFSAIGQFVQGFVAHLVDIGNWFVDHWPQIIAFTSGLAAEFEKFLPIITPIIGTIASLIGKLLEMPVVQEGIKAIAIVFGVIFLGAILAVIGIVVLMAAIFLGTAFVVGFAIGWMRSQWQGLTELFAVAVPFFGAILGAIGGWFGWLFSQIGSTVQGILSWIGQFLAWVGALASAVGSAVQGIIAWFGALFAWVGALFSAVGSAIQGIIAWFGALFSAIGSIVQGIIGWFGWFIQWVGSLASATGSAVQGIIAWFGALFSAIGSIVSGIVNWVIATWNYLWASSSAIFAAIVGGIVAWWIGAWASTVAIWTGIIGWAVATWNGLWASAVAIFGAIVGAIVSWFIAAATFIVSIWSFVWAWLGAVWNGIWTTAVQWLSNTLNSIVQFFIAAATFIVSIWSFVWAWLGAVWNGIWATAVQWLTNTLNSIVQFFTAIWNYITTLWTNLWAWLGATWNGIWGTSVQWLTNTYNSAVQFFTAVWNFITNLWTNLWAWLTGTYNGILGTTIFYFMQIFQTVQSWMNAVQGWVTQVGNALSGIMHNALSALGTTMHNDLNWIIAHVLNGFLHAVWEGFHTLVHIDLPIHEIGGFAQGGVVGRNGQAVAGYARGGIPAFGRGGNAGIYEQPTFLVAEGRAPETVIPWDSAYRSRAIDLWKLTGQKIGMLHGEEGEFNRVPTPTGWAFSEGGVMGGTGGETGRGQGINLNGIPTSGDGGQCLAFLSRFFPQLRGIPAAKDAAKLINSRTAKPGEVAIATFAPFGHAALVINPPNMILDSNWGGDEKIRIHGLGDMHAAGFIDFGAALGTLAGGAGFDIASFINGVVEDIVKATEPGAAGWLKTVPRGMLTQIAPLLIKWITDNFGAQIAQMFAGATSGFVGGVMSVADVTRLALQAGWPANEIPTLLRAIKGESSFNPNAVGPAAGGDGGSIGLMQIQPFYWPQFDKAKLRDPLYNLQAGLYIWRRQGWGAFHGLAQGGLIPGLGGGTIPTSGSLSLQGKPIAFDSGYNVLPPGLSLVYNGRRTPEALAEVGSRAADNSRSAGEGQGEIHNHFHGDVRVSPDLFQEAYRKADWYRRTGQF